MAEEGLLRFVYEHLQSGWAIVSLPLGIYLGNHYAIWRDQRTEWNDLTGEMSLGLLRQIDALESGRIIGDPEIDEMKVIQQLPKRKHKGFRACLKGYREAHGDYGSYDPATGGVNSEPWDIPKLLTASRALYRYLKRK